VLRRISGQTEWQRNGRTDKTA